MINKSKQLGLSILEVLVATAIIAILIAPMVSNLFNATSQNLSANREMTLASYIAKNHIAELQLEDKWPSTGTKDGEVEFANRTWKWQQQVVDTSDPNMRRVVVTILFGKDGSFAMTGFVGKKDSKG